MGSAHTAWWGRPLLDADGIRFGTVEDVLVSADEQPVWLEVQAAAGDRVLLVPATDVTPTDDGLRVPFSAATLHSAPTLPFAEAPTAAQEAELHRHFAGGASASQPEAAADDEVSVVRAEEELRISTEVQPAGTVRLRKWVETDTVSEEVVLHQEHLRIQRSPVDITNVDAVLSHAEIGEAEYEVVLRDEQVVATKVTVPREVVRLSKSAVQETVLVEADLRHEEVDVQRTPAGSNLAGQP